MYASRTNLLEVLTSNDKEIIENYIVQYGTGGDESSFCGVDTYLSNWAAAKTKLYHLLGDNLIVKFPFKIEKDEAILIRQVEKLLNSHPFINELTDFFYKIIENNRNMDYESRDQIHKLSYKAKFYIENRIPYSFVIAGEPLQKPIKVQEGSKIIKVLAKLAAACPEIFSKDNFEDFRRKHSQILNDKFISGNYCLSIHPMDFVTMSDNNERWTSCMSWVKNGCYRMGTVEMLNSNNVICAYVEAKKPFSFTNDNDETFEWNSKKWRQLFYVTKDIIVSGKPYPYASKEITFLGLNKLRELAQENMGWGYEFGPERYKDMKHINGYECMQNNKDWIHFNQTLKNNILFDTNAMYNDMLNDSGTKYWCVRNKVKKNKVIRISGKTICACCGKNDILNYNDYPEDYNDRFHNTRDVVCTTCTYEHSCDRCEGFVGGKGNTVKDFWGRDYIYCKNCLKGRMHTCPCCSKQFYADDFYSFNRDLPYVRLTSEQLYYGQDMVYNGGNFYSLRKSQERFEEEYEDHLYILQVDNKTVPLFMCSSCVDELRESKEFYEERCYYAPGDSWTATMTVSKKVYTLDELIADPKLSPYLWYNFRKLNNWVSVGDLDD